jgi:putative hemolysin
MIGSLHGTEAALSGAVLMLLVASGLLAMAETALVRMSKAKAKSLADDERHGAHDLVELVEHPQRFLNPVLLCILVCQLISATLIGVLAERFFGAWGIAAATVFEVVVIFVVFEAVPKNWAVHHPERAALLMAPFVKAVIAFPPVRWISMVLIGLANILIGHREDLSLIHISEPTRQP